MTLEDFRAKYGYDAVTLQLLVWRYIEATVHDNPEMSPMAAQIQQVIVDLRAALRDGVQR
jgi:hypothetical protein